VSARLTIGIVTYNALFYNKLALMMIERFTNEPYEILVYDNGSTDGSREWLETQDVTLFKSLTPNDRSHGTALDYLVSQCKTPVFCALDADAFPVSEKWTELIDELDDKVALAGIGRGWGYTLKDYVHPSYLFGKTEFIRQYSFAHRWPAIGPKYDTGELLTENAYKCGYGVKMLEKKGVDFEGRFKAKYCDYAGLVWHVWWSSRKVASPALAGVEFEPGYHEYCEEFFRKKYNLDF